MRRKIRLEKCVRLRVNESERMRARISLNESEREIESEERDIFRNSTNLLSSLGMQKGRELNKTTKKLWIFGNRLRKMEV